MTNLINADALLAQMKEYYEKRAEEANMTGDRAICVTWHDAVILIKSAPTVDAVPVRHGKWIPCAKSGLILTEQLRREGIRWYGFKCSVCNFVRKGNAPIEANYYECCGARMDEE